MDKTFVFTIYVDKKKAKIFLHHKAITTCNIFELAKAMSDLTAISNNTFNASALFEIED